jgi:hypothetical protein
MLPSSITGFVFLAIVGLSIGAFCCLAGATREAWADSETSVGVALLALALILHGVFITGASTFGPTPVLAAEIFGGQCLDQGQEVPCRSVDLSTGRGYLVNARPPEGVDFWTFYRGNKQVTAQISTWDNRVHWMRTDNTNPPTTVGEPARVNYIAVVELIVGLALLYLAFVIWREGKRRGIKHSERDPFLLINKLDK